MQQGQSDSYELINLLIASSKRVLEQLDVGNVGQVMRAIKGTQKPQLRQQKQQDMFFGKLEQEEVFPKLHSLCACTCQLAAACWPEDLIHDLRWIDAQAS